jgi:hypothetical protein
MVITLSGFTSSSAKISGLMIFPFYPEDPFSKTPPTSLQISQIKMQIIASMFYSVESSMP